MQTQTTLKTKLAGRGYRTLRRGWHWVAQDPVRSPVRGAMVSIGLVALVALLDFATGYEMRLAILYTLPIALATWTGGVRGGALASAAAVACWAIGFHPSQPYSLPIYFYWEAAVLIATFVIFVMLLHHLRSALERADRRFLHVLDGLQAGIYVTEESGGRLLYANRHFARMVGHPADERLREFEQRLTSQPALLATSEDGAPFHYQEARDEQTGHWYLIQSGPIPWENEERVQMKVLMDITDEKQSAVMKRQHQELLHDAARSAVLAEIASMLGHEINQPLMAITTYNDACVMLLSKDQPDINEVIVALGKSRAQALRASDIVDRTRGFLRRRAPDVTHCDINEVATEAVQALELELLDAAVSIEFKLGHALPEAMFDRTLVQQVVINLLRNAAEAVRDLEPSRRSIQLQTGKDDHDAILVTISDCGLGISELIAERLFTPFFTTKQHGLGLGLCICRSVIEAHAGRLWHSASPSGGAAFHFTLPNGAGYADE